jgi:uncharacterized Ntn-hydrolase superfamily protein
LIEYYFGTFSIAAYDPKNGDLGVAVASRYLAVGAVVPYARTGVGAIATQAWCNTSYGVKGLDMLQEGMRPQQVLEKLTEDDEGRDKRQVGIVNTTGASASYTGSEAQPWAGHRLGENYAVQGNILVGEEVVLAMERAFLNTKGDLADRLMAALEAGDAAGGDSRGKQAAAILVVRDMGSGYSDRYVDLRVDDHTEPVMELRRIYNLRSGK